MASERPCTAEARGDITSFPGLGPLTGARVLAETGDDRSRFTDAKGLKAYAGAAPITRASGSGSGSGSGKTLAVLHRRVKNQSVINRGGKIMDVFCGID